ncbi:MAG: twitching motility protein PilT [Lachnospiraceae bacterium]|nr:twitching motility protein PilT [Lachnospiraceae bacterium]
MVQLIVGDKGKGKTKALLDKVNSHIKTVEGNIVYLDKSTKHMYELNNKIRLINVTDYMISDADEFIGFLAGIISQDHDLQAIYLDSFLKIAKLEGQDITPAVQKIRALGEKFHVDFTISISLDGADIPEALKSDIEIAV